MCYSSIKASCSLRASSGGLHSGEVPGSHKTPLEARVDELCPWFGSMLGDRILVVGLYEFRIILFNVGAFAGKNATAHN
jgi:hypothetical protein